MPYENLPAFVTRDDLGDYLGRDLSADDLALIAVDSACMVVRNAAGQRLDRVTNEVILVDGDGTDTLLLPETPVVSVGAVLLNDPDLSVADATLDPAEDYLVDTRMGVLTTRSAAARWRQGRGAYKVTYTHGWATVPDDLQLVALQLSARVFDQGLAKQESVGGHSVSYAADDPIGLTRRELDVVAKYRPARAARSYGDQ